MGMILNFLSFHMLYTLFFFLGEKMRYVNFIGFFYTSTFLRMSSEKNNLKYIYVIHLYIY